MITDESNDDRTRSFETPGLGATVAHYRIIDKIGAGGMGEVYLAVDTKLKRKIALKFLSPQYAANDDLRSRIIREAQAAAALKHPNVVTIHEVAEYEGRPYIAMEYVEGQSLRDLIRRGKIDPEKSLKLMVQLCSGLKEAHQAGIVHRDIKPSNVMVDDKGRCVILDFGLAKGSSDSLATSPGAVVGTAAYMSPEQSQGLKVDHRSDIFSLGVLFYEMLTGSSPFRRENIPATVHAVVNDEAKRITEYLVGESDRWQQVIENMLAKDPLDRYQSVEQILADLDRLKDGVIIPQRSTTQQPAGSSRVRSLAVLYLRNLGPPEDEYLSYGITEDLIVDLTRIGSIRVAPMRSVLTIKDTDKELSEIAQELDVSLILDGSIRRSESKVRASAQLIDTASGKLLWADRWDDALDRLHLIKTALAAGVSRALNIDSSVVKAAQVGDPESKNPQAYEYYLRGKYAFEHRHSSADITVASELYDQALKLEPGLLAAREGVAEVLVLEGQYERAGQVLLSVLVDARQRGQQADEARTLRLLAQCFSAQSLWAEAASYAQAGVQASQELGDLAGEAAALGQLIETQQRRALFDEALRLAERVLQINRQLNDRDKEAEALNLIGTVYLRKFDCHRAMAMYREALSIATDRDQTSVKASSIGNIGTTYFYLGDFEKALSQYEESLRLFSDLGELIKKAATAQNMAGIHLSRGGYRKALELYETALAIYTKYHERARCAVTINNIAYVLIILGQYDEAIGKLDGVLEMATNMGYPLMTALSHANLGVAYSCRGEITRAAQEFQAAIELAERYSLRRVLAVALSSAGEMSYLTDRKTCYGFFDRALSLAEEVGDKHTRLMSQAYLATRDIAEATSPTGISRQREIVEEAEKFGNPMIILASKRLLAVSLMRFGPAASERREGRTLLHKLLSYAQELEIACESRWLRSLLDGLPDEP